MRLIYALLTLYVLGVTPVYADPTEPVSFPKCKLVGSQDGVAICGYTLDEYKLVLKADVELRMIRNVLAYERENIVLLTQQVTDIKSQLDLCIAGKSALSSRSEELTVQLIELDKKYQDARVRMSLESPIAWTIAAVSTSILAGVIVFEVIN